MQINIRNQKLRHILKKFNNAIDAENFEEAKELIKVIDKKLKRATHQNIVHKNAASRQISKLTKKN